MNSTLVALFEAHATKPFLWISFMYISVCVFVHFVEAHTSPLIYALCILSGTHIFAHLHSFIFVCVGKVSPFSIVLVHVPGTMS